ncbi:MAG: M15 family metallopeptidase [Lachnospiraceae bacterium]|nr:M15 family metallopeptidase [Lachnospiraceae bacterium]
MILACITVMAFLVHVITSGESLSEYADKHPEAAYGTVTFSETEGTAPEATEAPAEENDEETEQDLNEETRLPDREPVFYAELLTPQLIETIKGISIPAEGVPELDFEDLRLLHITFVNFEGVEEVGEMICNKSIAEDLLLIFRELYVSGYQIESMQLVEAFEGSDDRSMAANNTSCFNYRNIGKSSRLSRHGYGMAVDINPVYNPEIKYGSDGEIAAVNPAGSENYVNRDGSPHRIDENDLAYRLFTERGFIWGGSWNSSTDYMHFEKPGY